jgi:citrate synthase
MVGSSSCRIIRSISAVSGIGDLYMEANQAVLEMLEEIHNNGGDTDIYG